MKYLSAYVQQPTSPVAPTDTTTGTIQIAHRRKSLTGGYSGTQVLTGARLPNTLSIQRSANTEYVSAEEILLRDGPTGVWRKVPQSLVGDTGQVSLTDSTIPSVWETVTDAELADNQAEFAISALDFGTFNSASEPTQTVFLLNDGNQTINTLNFTVTGADGAALSTLNGRVRVDYLGVYSRLGAGIPDSAANGSLLYSQSGNNAYAITLAPNSAALLTLTLTNFPAVGLDSQSLSAEFVFVPNRNGFVVPTFEDWQDGSLLLGPDNPFVLATEDPDSENLLVSPYTVRAGGVIYSQARTTTVAPQVAGTGSFDLVLYISSAGFPAAIEDIETLPPAAVEVARLTWESSTGAITNYRTTAPIHSGPRKFREPLETLAVGRSVNLNSQGLLVEQGPGVGVAVSSNGYYRETGHVLLLVTPTVAVGDRLGATSAGNWELDSEGTAVALEAGSGLIQGYLLPPTGNSGGSGGTQVPTNLGLASTASTVEVTNSNGTGVTFTAATDSDAGLLTASDKIKLDSVDSSATRSNLDANRDSTSVTITNTGGTSAQIPAASTLVAGVMSASDKSKLDGLDGSGGSTNLAVIRQGGLVTITSDTGNDATIGGATVSQAGVMTGTDKSKLDGIEADATRTDLTISSTSTSVVINNSGGSSANFPRANATRAGIISGAEYADINNLNSFSPGFINGWTNFGNGFGNFLVHKMGNLVVLQGMIRNGATISSISTIVTLPSIYRPLFNQIFLQPCQGGYVRVDVEADGTLAVVQSPVVGNPQTWTVLNGIVYKAG